MVMVVEGHLNIQTHKLGQVTVGVGVLCPENWNDADLISMFKLSEWKWKKSGQFHQVFNSASSKVKWILEESPGTTI